MDCVAAKALKTSFWNEKSVTQQVFDESVWCGNGGNNGVSGDDLFVDGLLDFSNEDVRKVFGDEEGEDGKEEKDCSSFQNSNSNSSEGFALKDEFGSVLPSELSVPADELADLEWLSHFVEDSFSEFSLQHFPTEKPQIPNENRSEPETPVLTTGFLSSVPAKARSKRSRSGGKAWSFGSLSLADSSSSSSSSSPSSSSSSSCLIFNKPGRGMEFVTYLGKPPKKPKKKLAAAEAQQRRCSHCGVQKTPQWRTGPNGAKTLCNACGVRFKSGRLLPEYRPACSPTFSSEVHSNNHRKVLEMRRKKEIIQPSPPVLCTENQFIPV